MAVCVLAYMGDHNCKIEFVKTINFRRKSCFIDKLNDISNVLNQNWRALSHVNFIGSPPYFEKRKEPSELFSRVTFQDEEQGSFAVS